jgi:hypothetical protein
VWSKTVEGEKMKGGGMRKRRD